MRRCLILLVPAIALIASVSAAETFFGRVVGVTDGDTITVLHEGHAVKVRLEGIDCPESTKYSSEQALAEAEARARETGRGLWSRSDAVPPWEFRHGGRAAPATAAGSKGPYHGNVKSHVFHGSWCRYYDCKNCTAVFETREEAIDAGYRPGGGCQP